MVRMKNHPDRLNIFYSYLNTTVIIHIQGKFNIGADTFSRIHAVNTLKAEMTETGLDFAKLSKDQIPEVQFYLEKN